MTETVLWAFNKPYDVLSQFRDPSGRSTLADFIGIEKIYPAGRLDRDSEGLLLLTSDGRLQARLSQPQFKVEKTYLVQVEGLPDARAIGRLRAGITLKDGPCAPARVEVLSGKPPGLWRRDPPIRTRQRIPTRWLSIAIREGRNRQVRRMTAAVGLPTLRLIRRAIGPYELDDLGPGEIRPADPALLATRTD